MLSSVFYFQTTHSHVECGTHLVFTSVHLAPVTILILDTVARAVSEQTLLAHAAFSHLLIAVVRQADKSGGELAEG